MVSFITHNVKELAEDQRQISYQGHLQTKASSLDLIDSHLTCSKVNEVSFSSYNIFFHLINVNIDCIEQYWKLCSLETSVFKYHLKVMTVNTVWRL